MLNMKIEKTERKACRFVFRYQENSFASNGRIVFSQEWRLMKRLSCNDNRCLGDREKDLLTRCFSPFEDISEGGIENFCINLPKHPEHGKLYELIFCPGPADWETGYVDDWEWNMVPYIEEDVDA